MNFVVDIYIYKVSCYFRDHRKPIPVHSRTNHRCRCPQGARHWSGTRERRSPHSRSVFLEFHHSFIAFHFFFPYLMAARKARGLVWELFACVVLHRAGNFSILTHEAGAGALSIAMEGPSKADISLEDRKDGSCEVEYLCTEPGTFICVIQLLILFSEWRGGPGNFIAADASVLLFMPWPVFWIQPR